MDAGHGMRNIVKLVKVSFIAVSNGDYPIGMGIVMNLEHKRPDNGYFLGTNKSNVTNSPLKNCLLPTFSKLNN